MTIREELESIGGLNITIEAIKRNISFKRKVVIMNEFGTTDREEILNMNATEELYNNTMSFILYGFVWQECSIIEGEAFPFNRIYKELKEINKVVHTI